MALLIYANKVGKYSFKLTISAIVHHFLDSLDFYKKMKNFDVKS